MVLLRTSCATESKSSTEKRRYWLKYHGSSDASSPAAAAENVAFVHHKANM